jgi:enterochelin esterase-like enzyme
MQTKASWSAATDVVTVSPSPAPAAVVPAAEQCWEGIMVPPGGDDNAVPNACTPPYMAEHGRDLRIDLLRGYFVVAMIIDHVRGQSPLYLLTGGNQFLTSAAEGFILTSGLVAGLVYKRLIERLGLAPSLLKLLARAASLYLLTVGVTLLLLPVSEILYLPWAQGVDLTNPVGVVVSILTLHRTYYLIDVMLLYTVLFIVVPLAFVLLDNGKGWIVLAASWGLWTLYQFFPEYAALPWPIVGNYLFDFSAWQVLFVTGLVLGYYHSRIPTLGHHATRAALVATGAGTVALIALFYLIDPPLSLTPAAFAVGSPVYHEVRLWLQDMVFSKLSLRPGRLVASAVTFSFLFLLATVYWRQARRWLGWLFIPLGQSALYAYTAHILVATGIALALAPLNLVYPGPQWLNAAIQVASVLLIWVCVRYQVLAPTPRTKRLWYASPAVIAAAVILIMPWIPTPSYPGLDATTPVPASQARVPSRFGTPIPKATPTPTPVPLASGAVPAPTPTPTRTPTPTPSSVQLASDSSASDARLSPYRTGIQGSIIERWFYSPELDRDMPYVIYLPPDYATADRRYPVLYMLHGLGGHRDEWLAYGLMDVVDREILAGNIAPLIVVLPQGDKGYWADHTNDGPRWGAYMRLDVVQHIDSTYRTLREARYRAIGGLSMGGWGALHNSFIHPEVFAVVGAHSPSLRPDDGSLGFLGTGAEFAAKDPMEIAKTSSALGALQIWLDSAVEDPWVARARELNDTLTARGLDHTWQEYPGGHDWTYWHEHAIDYIRFYAHALERK